MFAALSMASAVFDLGHEPLVSINPMASFMVVLAVSKE
jgi:hypothetical protein